jgi:hypothetical protein
MSVGRVVSRSRVLALSACWTATAAATALYGPPAYGDEPPEQRSYEGHVLAGTGAYREVAGTVRLSATKRLVKAVPLPFLGGAEYAGTLVFRGKECHSGPGAPRLRGCLALSGTLAGTAVLEPHIGDGARADRLVSLSGRISPLGAVTASGRMVGTGFVERGQRRLYVLVANAKGRVSVGASGSPVPGFQSP